MTAAQVQAQAVSVEAAAQPHQVSHLLLPFSQHLQAVHHKEKKAIEEEMFHFKKN